MYLKIIHVLWILYLIQNLNVIKCQQTVDQSREDTTVDIKHYGEIKTAITTNRTKAYLSCQSGDMIVNIDFKEPFFGFVFANKDPLSPCKVEGNGKTNYAISLPLQGCGTREEPAGSRTFINDIVVRFHKGLIVDEDEVKTIICRYGPPLPPPILPLPPPPPVPPPAIVAPPKKLTEAEIYVILCVLLFLGLLLLGIGLAYYCLKKRNVKIVRKKRALSTAPASEITKLSGSTLGIIPPFRIPHARARSVSTLSDYPSESASEETLTRTIYEQDYIKNIEDHDESVLSVRELMQHQLVPPVYSKIHRKQFETVEVRDETTLESELIEEYKRRTLAQLQHIATINETSSIPEYAESVPPHEPEAMHLPHYDEVDGLVPLDIAEPPVLLRGPPATSRHLLDDYYLTTITETQTQEDEERRQRETVQTHMRSPPPATNWDVLIRAYPPELEPPNDRASSVTTDSENEQWDQMSYVSERHQSTYDDFSSSVVPPTPNWNVLIRVLKPKPPSEPSVHEDDLESVDELSENDREKWKKIITTDTTLRSMLEEARTVEEFENIRHDSRFERLFLPQKWDVIIRILSEPQDLDRAHSDASSTISEATPSISSSHSGTSGQYGRRFGRKNEPSENRSRRSSLSPVYEYDDYDIDGNLTLTRSRIASHFSDFDDQEEEDEAQDRRRLADSDLRVLQNWRAREVDEEDVLGQYLSSGQGPIARSIAQRTEVKQSYSKAYEY